jgi:hypothetical protein
MTDSTLNHVSIDYDQHAETVEKLFISVEECEIFNDALVLAERASRAIDARWDQNALQHTAVGMLGQAAEYLVAATAHYHYARIFFDILTELDAIQKANGEPAPAETEEA